VYVDGGGGGRIRGGHVLAIQAGNPDPSDPNGLKVWTWGRNDHKQTAITTSASAFCSFDANVRVDCVESPAVLPGRSNVIGLAAGNEHSVALKADGTVWVWGSQDFGQLGPVRTTGDVPTPIPVSSNGYRTEFLGDVDDIAAGGNHNLALRLNRNPDGTKANDGRVWAWGWDDFGQTGKTVFLIQSVPREMPGLDHVTRIAAGESFSLALKSDGTVWAWGRNDHGQLGASSSDKCGPKLQVDCSYSPIQVQNLTGVTDIAAGGNHSLAMTRP
jgi:alpha-tubulin suppressor-like RCC1 family protein